MRSLCYWPSSVVIKAVSAYSSRRWIKYMNRNWDANLKLGHYLILFLICECFLVFICVILHFCFQNPKSSCHLSLQKYSSLLSILFTAIRARWDNSLIVPHSSTRKARLPLSKSPPSFPGSSLCNHSWLKFSLSSHYCLTFELAPLHSPLELHTHFFSLSSVICPLFVTSFYFKVSLISLWNEIL